MREHRATHARVERRRNARHSLLAVASVRPRAAIGASARVLGSVREDRAAHARIERRRNARKRVDAAASVCTGTAIRGRARPVKSPRERGAPTTIVFANARVSDTASGWT